MAVVKYQSFSKAADRMYISQSAVSKNISQLEKSLGYILIDRSGGSIRLTAVGELFYDYYKRADEQYQRLMEQVHMLTDNQAGDIRLGCLDGWDLSQFYPQMRNLFKEKYPGVSLSLEGYDHLGILEALSANKIDIAITLGITLPRQSRFVSRSISTTSTVMMFSSSHHLAQKDDLSPYDFRDEPFYVIAPAKQEVNPMEQLALMAGRSAGFEPRIEYAPNSATILMRLQSGSGVQVTSGWTCATRFSIYKTLDLNHKLNVAAVWQDDGRTPSKHLFVNELMRLNISDN